MTAAGAQTRPRHGTVVDVADLKICTDPGGMLVTYALGSCIAVCVHDPIRTVIGMIHYMLPLSKISPEKSETKPAMFADTGVPLLFERMFAQGCRKESLVVKVVGGGNLHDENGTFNIGKRNHTVIRKLMWKNSLMIAAEDVGGQQSRTVRMYAEDGRVMVSSQGVETSL